MKETLTRFKCDECEKKSPIIEPINEGYGSTSFKYPYDIGWCYIHDINIKIFNTKEERATIRLNRDKHFCSTKCMLTYISVMITPEKKIKKGKKEVD